MEKLIEKLSELKDPRRQWGNLQHKLIDIVFIGFISILSGGTDFEHMEDTGRLKEDWFRQYLELPNGIPSADTFRRMFERLNPQHFSKILYEAIAVQGKTVAFDGKTICGSGNKEHTAYHVLSAWVTENQLTLGQLVVEEKTNEITAIPELIEIIDITDSTVTIDAMGCQKEIAAKIVENGADYVLNVKGNQPSLHDDIQGHFETNEVKETKKTSGRDHGRIEERTYYLETNIDWLKQREEWVNVRAIGMVCSQIQFVDGRDSYTECRYYITTLTDIDQFAHAVRAHWSIENQLHWHLDVTFREDASRARKNYSPLNLNIMRKEALRLLRTADFGKRVSIRRKMAHAAMSNEAIEKILNGF